MRMSPRKGIDSLEIKNDLLMVPVGLNTRTSDRQAPIGVECC